MGRPKSNGELSQLEQIVCDCLNAGMKYTEIAARNNVSEGTISTVATRLFRKKKVNGRAELKRIFEKKEDSMGVWNDRKIALWAASGGVTPFDAACVNPASLDLRLGNQLRIPHEIWGTMNNKTMAYLHQLGLLEQIPKWSEPIKFDNYLLYPGDFVLCSSLEFVNVPDDMITLLFSKSSTGRIGLEHLHAGLGDCGWHDANWTWELHNVAPWPIPLVAGKRIMQQIMIKMTDFPLRTYAETGRYNNQSGPTPVRAVKE